MRYKESIPGWYFKIHLDEKGEEASRQEFSKKHAFYKEMIASGIEIEPRFTPEEIKVNEAKEAVDALESKKSELLSMIKSNEYHLINGRHAADQPQWETVLKKWYSQLEEVKAGKLVEIEPAPVFE